MICQNCQTSLDASWLQPQTLSFPNKPSFSIDSVIGDHIRSEKICKDGLKSVMYRIEDDLVILLKEPQQFQFKFQN
jgi:hypothetical protein